MVIMIKFMLMNLQVFLGKGGVGKLFVIIQFVLLFLLVGYLVGVFDVDFMGLLILCMFVIEDVKVIQVFGGWLFIIVYEVDLIFGFGLFCVMSLGFLFFG